MLPGINHDRGALDQRFKIFHELMAKKVKEVLLISTPYDAWIMQEDGGLSERIVSEYRGLNLSNPPRLSWVSTVEAALEELDRKEYDLVILMARTADYDSYTVGETIKKKKPNLMVALLTHQGPSEAAFYPSWNMPKGTNETFVWSGNTDILLAIIKYAEDQMNVDNDTKIGGVRVIILVEDSPIYLSSLLPILYRQLVSQTQIVMEDGLNEEHRLLAMRARPKVLVTGSYENACDLFEKYESFILGVISDARIPKDGQLEGSAGCRLLKEIKKKRFDIPRLLYSAESRNTRKAHDIPAVFIDKNSPCLLSEVQSFLTDHLGFGDFIFKTLDGREIARSSNLWELEKHLKDISTEVFENHCRKNDFSRWLFARSEIELASKLRTITCEDFSCTKKHKQFLVSNIHVRRMQRQIGIAVNFESNGFCSDTEFLKIGNGSVGGKGRGLTFMSAQLHQKHSLLNRFRKVNIGIPRTLLIATDIFDTFVDVNQLKPLAQARLSDEHIAKSFLNGTFSDQIVEKLRYYLAQVHYPLTVRSSSLFEDARFKAYAGLYKTYMLPNDHEDLDFRLNQLLKAIKLVYASTYCMAPKAFSKRIGQRTEEEKMAVIVQELTGTLCHRFFYPSISGVAQSFNYYPFSKILPSQGVATIALGFGKAVMDGEKALRFCPEHPDIIPQFASANETLKNAQRYFYALELGNCSRQLDIGNSANLVKREISDAEKDPSVKALLSTYIQEENKIKDSFVAGGYGVLTFSKVLKHHLFPLADILKTILAVGEEGMGCPVEIEFSVELDAPRMEKSIFSLLQIRPMSSRENMAEVNLSDTEISQAFCVSSQALGNNINNDLTDIIYVNPNTFDPARTMEIAQEIAQLNSKLQKEEKRYLLVGPGRWGSADRWLGIPVNWPDICGTGAIVETTHPKLKADPSQGSHFFHNITSLGVNYLTVFSEQNDKLDWQWLFSLPKTTVTKFLIHSRLNKKIALKVDGRRSLGIIVQDAT